MTRFHTTEHGDIPFTEEEEQEADAMEADFLASRLSKVKTLKLEAVEEKFCSIKHDGVAFLGATFKGGIDCAQLAKSKADMLIRQGEAGGGSQPFLTTFNDIDHNPVELDTDQLQDLAVTVGLAYESLFHKRARLKRAINALATVEEIESFDIESEWNL